MQDISKRWWFIATYRWAVICLVPATVSFAGWLVFTVYSGQIALADMTSKVNTVIYRVDRLEDANRDGISARNQNAINIADRMARLETSNENLAKAIDRLVRIMDSNPQPRNSP